MSGSVHTTLFSRLLICSFLLSYSISLWTYAATYSSILLLMDLRIISSLRILMSFGAQMYTILLNMYKEGIDWARETCMLIFSRHCQTEFRSGCMNLHSQWMRVPVTAHPHRHLVLLVVLMSDILADVQ